MRQPIIKVSLDEETHDRITEMSQRYGLSASSVVRTLAVRALDAERDMESDPPATTEAVLARLEMLQHQIAALGVLVKQRQYGGPWS